MPFLGYSNIGEFDKMQIPFTMLLWRHLFHVKLVWRLLEFAFLCAYFGRRIFDFRDDV